MPQPRQAVVDLSLVGRRSELIQHNDAD
jgi:hypothetical protein